MAHTLFIYDIADLTKDIFRSVERRVFDDADALRTAATEIAAAANHPFVVGVRPDPALCADIPAYVALSNLRCDLIEAGIGQGLDVYERRLVDDLDAWAEMGITTSTALAAYLAGVSEKDIEEAAW